MTTQKEYRILLDDIDSNQKDFEELNIVNTDEDDAIATDMEKDQSEDQILDHGNDDDQGKLLPITFIIYMRKVILAVTLFYLLFRTQQLLEHKLSFISKAVQNNLFEHALIHHQIRIFLELFGQQSSSLIQKRILEEAKL